MKIRMILVTAMLVAMLSGMLTLGGCNTWNGFGQDIENTGQAIQGEETDSK